MIGASKAGMRQSTEGMCCLVQPGDLQSFTTKYSECTQVSTYKFALTMHDPAVVESIKSP